MTEQLQQYALELAEAVKGIAPEALAMAVQITRITAIGDIALGVVFVVAIRLAIPQLLRLHRAAKADPDSVGLVFAVVFGWFGTVVVGIFAGICLLNIWTWVGLFAPELRLAHDALARLVGAP